MERFEGVWRGEGVGEFPPRVAPFEYVEELVISRPCPEERPHLFELRSVTRDKHSDKPLHRETAFVRTFPHDKHRVEFMVTHPFGLVEISQGNVAALADSDSVRLEVVATAEGFARTSTAKPPFVTELRRFYELKGGSVSHVSEIADSREYIDFICEMATTTAPLQTHLVARLHRVG